VRKEVESLSECGFRVDVLCVRSPGEVKESAGLADRVTRLPLLIVRGSRSRYVFQYTVFLLLAALRLATSMWKGRYALVHVHSLPDFLVLAALPARLRGTPVVLDLHESMPELYLARFGDRAGSVVHQLALLAQRLSCAAASRVITVNPTIASLLARRGVNPSQVTVVENAPKWDGTWWEAPAVPSVDKHVVIVGGLNRERDLDTVLRAAAILGPRFSLKWRVIGRGEDAYVRRLTEVRDVLGLQTDVSIEPEVPAREVPGLLRETLVGVVSYERNPLTEIATPNKAYEYAALGKPMVVADLPALRELFGDSVSYYVPGNPESLANSLVQLLEDENLRRVQAERVRERHREHRWQIMEGRLLSLYSSLLTPKSQARGVAQ
jgi:glycosyltransferase involved in cell wall biosynthesis